MNGQTERCDRTAYVSGLQPTVTDIELFEVFNRVAHVEKVIVRSGSVRHALIVFKTVEGLYQALLNFQGTTLHSRQLHIRPLRESSHNNNNTSGGGGGGGQQSQRHHQNNHQQKTSSTSSSSSFSSYRPSSQPEHQNSYNRSYQNHQNSSSSSSSYQPPRGYHRNSSGTSSSSTTSYGNHHGQRRRYNNGYGYNNNHRNGFQNDSTSYSSSGAAAAATSYDYAQYSRGYHQGGGGGNGHYQYQYHHQNPAQQHDFHFEDHAEGAKRFDNLANLIRATTPTDPFAAPSSANFQKSSADSSIATTSPPPAGRSRTTSTTHQKHPPPAWKMELARKAASEVVVVPDSDALAPTDAPDVKELSMSQHEFLAQIARQAMHQQHQQQQKEEEILQKTLAAEKEEMMSINGMKKRQRPNLSVINPSLFYEQYPRTSSPVVVFAPSSTPNNNMNLDNKSPSPHDPAVLAYSRRLRQIPSQSFGDGLSPIDTNECSFITKHLGAAHHHLEHHLEQKRDLTNEELSDMIVSTGNLRIVMPTSSHPMTMDSFETPSKAAALSPEGPAPWSPLKRLRAESGSLSTAPLASPQFSPIRPKMMEENTEQEEEEDVDDDVFASGASIEKHQEKKEKTSSLLVSDHQQQKMTSDFEDINNSRLPSNSHSAAPSSEQKSFVFPPEYPMCRHSSVPSIAHLVGDLSDFCPPSPVLHHLTVGEKMLMTSSGGSSAEMSEIASEDIDKTAEEKESSSAQDDVIKIRKASADVVVVV